MNIAIATAELQAEAEQTGIASVIAGCSEALARHPDVSGVCIVAPDYGPADGPSTRDGPG